MDISYFTGPTWKVLTVGEGDNRKLPPDQVEVDEKVRFVKYDKIVQAQVVSDRFGNPSPAKAGPPWMGLTFCIVQSSDGVINLLAPRLIWDECRGKAYWHTLQIAKSDDETGIDCDYHEGLHLDAEHLAILSLASAHEGTWHAGGD